MFDHFFKTCVATVSDAEKMNRMPDEEPESKECVRSGEDRQSRHQAEVRHGNSRG